MRHTSGNLFNYRGGDGVGVVYGHFGDGPGDGCGGGENYKGGPVGERDLEYEYTEDTRAT